MIARRDVPERIVGRDHRPGVDGLRRYPGHVAHQRRATDHSIVSTLPVEGVIVILLDRPQDAWLAEWSGADAWFVKPFDPFELADRVVDLLREKETA